MCFSAERWPVSRGTVYALLSYSVLIHLPKVTKVYVGGQKCFFSNYHSKRERNAAVMRKIRRDQICSTSLSDLTHDRIMPQFHGNGYIFFCLQEKKNFFYQDLQGEFEKKKVAQMMKAGINI